MKLIRLLLQAFGPFTDTVLDFATSPANLHLIYGPNEAGKSSALRAMTDLRFGIPLRSPDDFMHPASQLRIAGVFIDNHGEPLGLVRRKGRGSTLSRFDVATGQPAPALLVLREHELALTGGLERTEFEAMFGLNHERLREGGKLLLNGEGDLGSALFEASAGTRGIAALLAALDVDAKQLYNPHGRAQNAIINDARRQLDEQRQALRQAQIRPTEWQTLNRAHETTKTALDEVDRALEALRRRENELAELRTVEPLLRDYDRARAELQTLADIPDLFENAREERLAAEQALRRVQQDIRECEVELVRCSESLSELVIEPLVLDHADAIERLVGGVETAARSRIEVQQQKAVIARIESDLGMSAARLAPGRELDEILQTIPSDADRVALDGHLLQVNRLGERLHGYRQRADALEEALKLDAEQVPIMPNPASREALTAALYEAQSLGDVARKRADLDRQIRELEGQLMQMLSDLGTESEQALRNVQPLLEAQITDTREKLDQIDEASRNAHAEDTRLERDLDEQRLRQRQLAAEGEVITAETLRLTRMRRDEGWTLIRQAYVERIQDAEELGRAFDPKRPLSEAFEASQSEADRQADLLRADAKRAAGFEECSARIEQMEGRRQKVGSELTMLAAQHDSLLAGWTQRLAQARLPDMEADVLREWQGRRENALQLAARLAALRADRNRVLAEATAAASAVVEALRSVGAQPVEMGKTDEVAALPSLINQADRWNKSATKTEAEHSARMNAARAQRADLVKIGMQIAETDAELLRHMTVLRAWHARLFLPDSSTPEAVKARLGELDGMTRQFSALNEARLHLAHHQAVVDDLAGQAVQLAALLGEPPPVSVNDFADRLRTRLATSREHDQQRKLLTRDHKRAQDKKRQAETEQEMQMATLERLCTAACVKTVDQLPEREDSATRKHQAKITLSRLRQQLTQSSSRSEAALRESLAGQDAVAMDSERERCRADIAQREREQVSARQAEENARRALEAVDSSDRAATAREAMESSAARFRAAVRPWARLKLAHTLLQEALNRFRDRAQAPMVASATTYFSLMTGHRYERLVADEDGNTPVLRAVRGDGVRIGVEAMSDGTSDQLYLALRLAALELRRTSHPQMPLVLDDVLVTSDDERTANILRALARFAEGGQVMIFTHHRHLFDVARAALAQNAFALHTL